MIGRRLTAKTSLFGLALETILFAVIVAGCARDAENRDGRDSDGATTSQGISERESGDSGGGSSPWPDGSAGRLTRSARRLTLCICHSAGLGKHGSVAPWPGCERFHSQPDDPSATDPPSGQPKVPADSRLFGPRAPLAASSPRHLALPNVPRRSQSLAAAAEDRHRPHLPEIVPGPSPPLAPHRPFRRCNAIPSVDLGLD